MEDYEPKLPDPKRAYMKDDLDVAAYKLYLRSGSNLRAAAGFHPPERPDGFLNESEMASWERWRQKAKVHMEG